MTPDLPALIDSWALYLKADRKSPDTIRTYTTGARQFVAWCAAAGRKPALDKSTVNRWLGALIDGGAEGATVAARQMGVRRFSAWLAEEEEIDADQLAGMKQPSIDSKVVEPLSADELRALLAACSGKGFRDRRDEAMVRFLAETGARAGELVAMETGDLDVGAGIAIVRRGKGGKGRRVPFGPQTARAIDRYLRARRTHRLAAGPRLWLGDRGQGLGYDGMRAALLHRAQAAGIAGFHPHRLRHTLADRWLAGGGSEGGLMAVAGWTDPAMLRRYTRARAEQRGADEARRLDLGNL